MGGKTKQKKNRKTYADWTGKVALRTRKKFLAVGKACMAIF